MAVFEVFKNLFKFKSNQNPTHFEANALANTPEKNLRKNLRVKITELRAVHFYCKRPTIENCSVMNISVTGIGFTVSTLTDIDLYFSPGKKIHGVLFIQQTEFPIDLEIKHISGQLVGCEFKNISANAQKAIKDYFQFEFAAASLNEIDANLLNETEDRLKDGESVRYFVGQNGSELYLTEKPKGQVLSFYGSFYGNYFEGGLEIPTRFGTISEGDPEHILKHYPGSSIISFDKKYDILRIETAVRFIENCEKLPDILKAQIITLIRKK